MDSKQTNFLFLYGLIVTLIVISFAFIRRSPRSPTKLDLRVQPPQPGAGHATGPQHSAANRRAVHSTAQTQPQITGQRVAVVEDDTAPGRAPSGAGGTPPEKPKEKPLNVLFNWNGYTWDAYEVLGVPAGSSREAVRQAFQRAQTQSTSEALPFLQAAADAIESQFSSKPV